MPAFFRYLLWLSIILLVPQGMPSAAAAGPCERTLVIENNATGFKKSVACKEGELIVIRFFHSYDRQWVKEAFRITEKGLVPVEVVYHYDSYDYRHQRYKSKIEVSPDGVRLSEIEPKHSDTLRVINFRVAFTKPQELIIGAPENERRFLFTSWGKPGEPLVLTVK